MNIFNSVGVNSYNDPNDVKAVQYLLNYHTQSLGLDRLSENGFCGFDTYDAINKFQKSIFMPPTAQLFPGDPTFKKLRSSVVFPIKYFVVKKGVIVKPELEPLIREVSDVFYVRNRKIITISDGHREPEDQAHAMFNKVDRTTFANDSVMIFDNTIRLSINTYKQRNLSSEIYLKMAEIRYKYNFPIPRELVAEYRNIALNEMSTIITAQVAKRQYISKHLLNKAFDISVRNLSKPEQKEIVSIAKHLHSTFATDQEKTGDPHIHIQF